MKILITGATGLTGREIAQQALAQEHEVTALVRDGGKAAALIPGARLVWGMVATLPLSLAPLRVAKP